MLRLTPMSLLALLALGACAPGTSPVYLGDDDIDTGSPPPADADNDGYVEGADCDDTDPAVGLPTTWYLDADSDGWGDPAVPTQSCTQPDGYVADATDCDDAHASINPGATEVCDNVDQDCNGEVDDGQDWYLDRDSDGYGDADFLYEDGCDGSTYLVADSTDCDDDNADVNPGATEVCNDIDDDCDGSTDVDASGASAWFADEDEDSYGDGGEYMAACDQPSGYVSDWNDCDDANPLVNPGETEVCDELDNDCDGDVDEEVTTTFYADTDGDSFGDEANTTDVCEIPSGYVQDSTDCDDTDASVSPGATEVCNSVDDDCDGSTDPDTSADASIWYSDSDSDGWGDAASSSVSCSAPSGTVSDATDCDDTEASVNPGATEVCNDADDDCDGSTDPSTSADASTWYSDADDDLYGDASASFVSCESPVGYVSDATDCDDGDATSYPGATEVCDGADNDCDGSTDPDDSADASTWYSDADTDGWGDSSSSSTSCSAPSGAVADATDCDDTDSSVYPGATEYCDEQDNDCDGDTDEDVDETFYADTDSDGYGDPAVSADACSVTSGYSANADDCDDSDASVSPAATEVCNSVDDDCDGDTDEDDSADASTWYTDGDSDGYGDAASSSVSCSAPSGSVSDSTDCDDSDASANPGATEVCDTADNDCDGNVNAGAVDATTWYPDSDGDAYGNASGVTVTRCNQPSSYVADSTDCDDGDATSYPGAAEYCDSEDNDCDGSTDPDTSVDASVWYADDDTDGYGDPDSSSTSCSAPSGSISDATDCDDTDEFVNPDAIEVCGDTADNDCDGDTDSSPCVTEGNYEGDFAIELTETTYGLGSDSCEGTATLTVDTTADPMISGTVECEFVGDASAYFPDTYSGTVEGDFDIDLLPSGTIDWTTFGWSFDWTDDGSGDTNVDGTFSGSDTYLGFGFDYTGDFATDYTP